MRAFILILLAAPAGAQVPTLIQHHGRLLGPDDVPVTGQAAITLALYEDDAPPTVGGETAIWQGAYTVNAFDGVYSALIGDTGEGRAALPANAFPVGEARYLQIKVGNDVLQPRLPIGSIPFAFTADHADTARDADTLDGLDSSAFLPASVETKIDAIDAATGASGPIQTKLGAIDTALGQNAPIRTALADLSTSLGTVLTNTGTNGPVQSALGTIATDTGAGGAIQSMLGDVKNVTDTWKFNGSLTATLNETATDAENARAAAVAVQTAVAALPGAALFDRLRYSRDCNPAVDTWLRAAWAGMNDAQVKDQCLHDGRWHRLGKIPAWNQNLADLKVQDVQTHVNAGAEFMLKTLGVGQGSSWRAVGVGGPNNDTIRFYFNRVTYSGGSGHNFLHWSEDETKTTDLYTAEDTDFQISGGWGFHIGWARRSAAYNGNQNDATDPNDGHMGYDFEVWLRY